MIIETSLLKYNQKVIEKNTYQGWSFEHIRDNLYKYHNTETGQKGNLVMFGGIRTVKFKCLIPLYEISSNLTDEQLNISFAAKGLNNCHNEFLYNKEKPLYEKSLKEADYILFYETYATSPSKETILPIKHKNALKKYLTERCSLCFSTYKNKTTTYAMINIHDLKIILKTGKIPAFAHSFIQIFSLPVIEWGEFIKIEQYPPTYPEIINVINDEYKPMQSIIEYQIMKYFLELLNYTWIKISQKSEIISVTDNVKISDILNCRIIPKTLKEQKNNIRITTKWDKTLSLYEMLLNETRFLLRGIIYDKFMTYFPNEDSTRNYLNMIYDCDHYEKEGIDISTQLFSFFAGKLTSDIITPLDLSFIKDDYTIKEIKETVDDISIVLKN